MRHKIALISLALIGLVFAFSNLAWAGRDHHRGHRYEKHYKHGGPYREHRGWHQRPGRYVKPFHHGPRHRFKHHGPKRRIVEKHVYHHYPPKRHYRGKHYYHGDRYYRGGRYYHGDRYYAAGGLWDPGFFFSFGISGSR